MLVDRDHRVPELFGIVNVPTALWIDEQGTIARAPVLATGDDTFIEFTHVSAEVHHDQLRRWVATGELPALPAPAGPTGDEGPTAAEQQARVERRLAAHLQRRGLVDAAERHFRRAAELAPMDWTIRRGSLPLQGKDPFLSEEFIELYQQWDAAGRPGHRSPEEG